MNSKKEKLYHDGLLLFMLIYGGILSFAAEIAGSSRFLGAFMAGLAFSTIKDTTIIWENKVLNIQQCLMAIFFASIGFIIPAQELFQLNILFKGILYSLVAAFGKLVTGFAHSSKYKIEKLIVGFSMIARGELGLTLILQSFESGLMSRDSFTITCWAITICTLLGAIGLQYTIKRQQKQNEINDLET
ncbi:732_t:CDS:1 [Gigaspora margarita]|uniref:732_t:CDS:1 n=1 Tax=Gigaspora margarita TaxID=4874 RepID=A0ABN7V2D1_GIGMA|nr:732_t:CDS:1 [Gigaspora margarita]